MCRGAGKHNHIQMSFTSFDLDPRLLRGVTDLGFTDPTPIQLDAMPPALAGRDVLACAMTRSGKTAAPAGYGGVAMGPQEKAFRNGTDVIVACPGRLLDHFQYPYARLAGLEVLV